MYQRQISTGDFITYGPRAYPSLHINEQLTKSSHRIFQKRSPSLLDSKTGCEVEKSGDFPTLNETSYHRLPYAMQSIRRLKSLPYIRVLKQVRSRSFASSRSFQMYWYVSITWLRDLSSHTQTASVCVIACFIASVLRATAIWTGCELLASSHSEITALSRRASSRVSSRRPWAAALRTTATPGRRCRYKTVQM